MLSLMHPQIKTSLYITSSLMTVTQRTLESSMDPFQALSFFFFLTQNRYRYHYHEGHSWSQRSGSRVQVKQYIKYIKWEFNSVC